MSQKRGRPVSESTEDPALNRRRQLAAARVRDFRQRQSAAHGATPQPTQAQLQQGERIVELGFTDQDAAETLTQLQLGLRVQGLTLARDTQDAQLRERAIPIDEHDALYLNNNTTTARSHLPLPSPATHNTSINTASPSVTRRPSGQAQLTHFFSSRPYGNPFSLAATRPTAPFPIRRSPVAPSFSSLSSPAVESIGGRGGSEDLTFADNDPDNDADDEGGVEEQESEYEDADIEARGDDDGPPGLDEGNGADFVGAQEEDIVSRHSDDGEEESVYQFASERSAPSSDGESIPPLSDLEHTVEKLLAFFQGDVGGCTVAQHDERRRQHMATVADDDHHGLNDIFHDPNLVSVLASPSLLTSERLAHHLPPTPAQLQSAFCGISPQHPQPQHVCLHQEETREQSSRQASDVDSYLGFLHSLAACRQGLWHQPAPQAKQNMTTDLHLDTHTFVTGDDPEQAPRAVRAMLRDVPHFLLGRVAGAHDITIHVLFAHLPNPQDKFVSLTKDQLSRWLDRIFYPAVYRHCEAHYTQHLPASFRHAYSNSKARQVEGRKIETASYQAQQSLGHHLQPEYLEPIWTDVLHTIDTVPGLGDFREPQLFFSAKGSKLQFKTSPSRPTLLDAMQHFESYVDDVFDHHFVDWERTYVDLAFEICPGVGHLATDDLHVDEEPQVLSWRRCCQEQIIRRLYDNNPPAKTGRGQRYYEQNMLYEATTVTSVPPKHSRLYRGGVRYIQLYGSVKEVWDAAKSKPFDNDGLEEMALDPQIRQAARHLAGGHRRDAAIIERAFCASKRRAHEALRDSRYKSFGIRAEFRISWPVFRAVMDRLRWREPGEELEVVHTDAPSYTWAIKTDVYLDFLWRNLDKFASLFELIRARCRQDLVTWEQTKMMAMPLRCLRFVLGGHQLNRESALWWSRRERQVGNPPQPRIWYGLGFCNTLPRYGYCWLEPRIDWERLVFQSAVTDRVLFGNGMLRGQYLRRGGQIEDFFHTTRRLELALDWIVQHRERERIRDQLIFWMVHICLQQFRVDVLSSIKSEIQEDHREEALRGIEPFCFEYFEEILLDNVYLISGNRCDFKQPTHLGYFLFDFDDGRVRAHWENRPFRKLYRRAQTALSLLPRELRLGQTFSRRFWRCLFAYHWVLPCPCAEVLTQTTKQGQRMMYSIELTEETTRGVEWAAPTAWKWERKSWRPGRPPRPPPYLSWSRDEWEQWMGRQL